MMSLDHPFYQIALKLKILLSYNTKVLCIKVMEVRNFLCKNITSKQICDRSLENHPYGRILLIK